MAKRVYGPDFGTISVLADDEKISDGDHEVTAEQALQSAHGRARKC